MAPARQRLAALVLIVLYLVGGGTAFAYAAAARPPAHPAVYAVDAHHHVLRSGARLRAGQRITIYARGFAARAVVQTVDANRRVVGHVRANRKGVAHLAYRVPVHLKPHRGRFVALDGRVAGRHVPPKPHGTKTTSPRVSRSWLQVTVPLIRTFSYRVGKGAHGVAGVSVGPGGGAHGGGLASTGFDVIAFLAAGGLALVLGAVALGFGRRRPLPR